MNKARELKIARRLIARVPMRNFTLSRNADLLLLIEVEAHRNIMNGEWILEVNDRALYTAGGLVGRCVYRRAV